MVHLADQMLDTWGDDTVVDLHPQMMALGLRIAAKTMLSAEVEADVQVIETAMNDILAEISRRCSRLFLIPDAVPLPGHVRYRRGVAAIEAVVARIIEERRGRGEDRGDLISMLMAARDDDGKPMTSQQLRDEVLTMLLAAIFCEWDFECMYEGKSGGFLGASLYLLRDGLVAELHEYKTERGQHRPTSFAPDRPSALGSSSAVPPRLTHPATILAPMRIRMRGTSNSR